jgi:hypothetical protein
MKNNMFTIKILSISLILTLLFSCNDDNNIKIRKLEKENKRLKELIDKNEHEKIINTQILLLPHNNILKLNEKNKISIIFSEIQEYPNFELFYTDNEFNYDDKNKIKISAKDKNIIEFDFIPKSRRDNIINLVATTKSDSGNVKLYGTLELPVE